jgi:hypothetical protein
MPAPAPPTDTVRTPDPQPAHRLHISATQLIASALAAVTATVAASYLGVSGTVVGAAVASVVTVTGNAVYGHSLRRTGARVRTVAPAGARWLPAARAADGPTPDTAATPRHSRWPVIAAAALGVFAGMLLLVTVIEAAAGRPLSDLLRGRSGSGTTVFGSQSGSGSTPSRPRPTVTVTVVPHVVTTTPTVTVTAPDATATVTPTVTVTPSPSESPTPSPTATPSPSVSPSSSPTP